MTYKTAAAFRQALVDRLKQQAKLEGVDLDRLQKRLAFERFLARLFHAGDERWVLKGGYALELRLKGQARATQDLDLNVPPLPSDDLLEQLQVAAETDLKDFFEFRVSPTKGELAGPPLGGQRFRVEARVDGRVFNRFPVDVGLGDVTIREPEQLDGQVNLDFAGISLPSFAVYPLEDHFAEKLHAYTTPRENPSRVKDLVDMLLLLDLGLQAGPLLEQSVKQTFERYQRHPLPNALPKPPEAWRETFVSLAKEIGLATTDVHEAYQLLRDFLLEQRLL